MRVRYRKYEARFEAELWTQERMARRRRSPVFLFIESFRARGRAGRFVARAQDKVFAMVDACLRLRARSQDAREVTLEEGEADLADLQKAFAKGGFSRNDFIDDGAGWCLAGESVHFVDVVSSRERRMLLAKRVVALVVIGGAVGGLWLSRMA